MREEISHKVGCRPINLERLQMHTNALEDLFNNVAGLERDLSYVLRLARSARDALQNDVAVTKAIEASEVLALEEAERDALVTIADVQKILGYSRQTIYRLRKSGSLPPHVQIGRKTMWKRSEIRKWIDGHHRWNERRA